MRVRPVEFAKMCGVSRQAVSKWIKRGLFTVGPDGRFDPAIAWRQVLECSDPAKLRARVFKDAVAPVAELRKRILTLEAENAAITQAVTRRCGDETAAKLGNVVRRLAEEWESLAQTNGRERALWRVVDSVFYPEAIAGAEDGHTQAPDGHADE